MRLRSSSQPGTAQVPGGRRFHVMEEEDSSDEEPTWKKRHQDLPESLKDSVYEFARAAGAVSYTHLTLPTKA